MCYKAVIKVKPGMNVGKPAIGNGRLNKLWLQKQAGCSLKQAAAETLSCTQSPTFAAAG